MTTRRFSGYLRELLEEKGMTVSGLARLTGVERTALSKVLAGQRVLPYGALDGLIYHLRLTPDEEERLRESYDAQFEQEGVRRSRAMVGKLFSDLAELDFVPPAFEESRLLLDLEGYAGRRSIFNGTTNSKLPSTSVATPVVVPWSTTVAPAMGKESRSMTRPLMVTICTWRSA